MHELEIYKLLEAGGSKHLDINKLKYSRSDLSPVISKTALDKHLELANKYAERYNENQGNKDFNEAGVFLHNLFFSQLKSPSSNNKPAGPILSLIKRKFDSFGEFKEDFAEQAMKIQGSGWVYLSRNGEIKTIRNHVIRNDIVLLVDWWEHAWFFDYGSNKKKYLENIWRIINWSTVNSRL